MRHGLEDARTPPFVHVVHLCCEFQRCQLCQPSRGTSLRPSSVAAASRVQSSMHALERRASDRWVRLGKPVQRAVKSHQSLAQIASFCGITGCETKVSCRARSLRCAKVPDTTKRPAIAGSPISPAQLRLSSTRARRSNNDTPRRRRRAAARHLRFP